jgi:hypothetical protein
MTTRKAITNNNAKKIAVTVLAFLLTASMVGASAVTAFADKPAKNGGVTAAAPPTGAETASDLTELISGLGANDNVVLSGDIEILSNTNFGNMAGKTVWLNGFSFRIKARNISIDFGGLVLDGDSGMGGISCDVAGADTDVLRISNATLRNIMGQNAKGVIVIGKNNPAQRLDTVLANITITDCTEDMVSLHGDCVLNTVTVKDCTSSRGAMVTQNMDNKSLTLNGCMIKDNTCTRSSDGTVVAAGVLTWGDLNINNSTISGNNLENALWGGGAFAAGNVHITDSTISGNSSKGYGGGLVVYDWFGISPNINIEDSEISNNSAGAAGGGIFAFGNGTTIVDVTITDTTVSDNHTQGVGGGIYNNHDSAIHLNGSTIFSGNAAASNAATNDTYPAQRGDLLIMAVPQSKMYNGQEQPFNNIIRVTGLKSGDTVYYKDTPLTVESDGLVSTNLITMKYPGEPNSFVLDGGHYVSKDTTLTHGGFVVKNSSNAVVTGDYNLTYNGTASPATITAKPVAIDVTVSGPGVSPREGNSYSVRGNTSVNYIVEYDGIIDDFATTASATTIAASSDYYLNASTGAVFDTFLSLGNIPVQGVTGTKKVDSSNAMDINNWAAIEVPWINSASGASATYAAFPYNFTVNFPSIKVIAVKDELRDSVVTGTGIYSDASLAIDSVSKIVAKIDEILNSDPDALSQAQIDALNGCRAAVQDITDKRAALNDRLKEALDILKDASASQLAIDTAYENMKAAISGLDAAIDVLTNASTGAGQGLTDALGAVPPTHSPGVEVGVTYIYKGAALPAAPTGYYNEAGSYDWSAQAKADLAAAEAGEYDVEVIFTPNKAMQYTGGSFVAKVAVLDKEALDDKIKEANGLLNWAKKNIGEGAGKISQATCDALENAIGAAREVADKTAGAVSQNDIDDALAALEGALGAVRLTSDGRQQATQPGITVPTKIPNVQKIRTPLKTIYLTKGKSYKIPYALDTVGGKPISDAGMTVTADNAKKPGSPAVAKVLKSMKGGNAVYSVKAQKIGKSTVTLKAQNGKAIKVKVVVQKKKVSLKKFKTKLAKSLKKGKSYQIKINGLTKKASNINTVTFKSSKKSVATVDAAGKVTAIKKGTVKITVKAGSKKVVGKLTVK